MNKRIIIEGERVHHVGYRPFLLTKAMKLEIQRFEAENVVEKEKQRVIVSIGGEEEQIQEFVRFVKENYPSRAKVLRVIEDSKTPERVMNIDDYRKVLSTEQQNTIVQAGLMMVEKQDRMLEKQDRMLEKQDRMLEKQEQTIEEVRGVREGIKDLRMDMRNYLDQRFERLEREIGKIKARIGM